jgi:hypothetical protein
MTNPLPDHLDPLTLDARSAAIARAAVTASSNETGQPPDRRPTQPLHQPGDQMVVRTNDGKRQIWREYGWIDHQGRMYDLYEPSPRAYQAPSYSPLWVLVDVEQVEDEPAELEAVAGGLEPDQQIRVEALDTAALIALAGGRSAMVDDVLDLADGLADWIRTGTREVADAE